MARGGFREGAGRKKEYNEPVKKILIRTSWVRFKAAGQFCHCQESLTA